MHNRTPKSLETKSYRRASAALLAALVTAGLASAPSAHALTQTWSNAAGGDFNTVGNWTTTVPVSTDTALFNSALSGNVTLSANATPGSLNFDTNATSFALGTLGGNSLKFANSGNLSVLSTLTGTSNTFTVNAPIVLTPASATTAGAFTIQNNATSPTNTLVVAGGISSGTTSNTTTLTLGGTNTGSNTISGIANGNATTFGVTKSGVGTWVLSGANTYSGLTQVSGGTLVLNGTNSSAGNTQVGGGSAGTLSLGTGANNGLASGTITFQNGSIQSSDANARTISNAISLAGTVPFINTSGTGDLFFTDTSTVKLSNASGKVVLFNILNTNTTFAQSFANGDNNGDLQKIGAGTLILTGASTYTGTTEIKAGTLSVGSIGNTTSTSSNIGAGTSTLRFSGGTLLYTGANAVSDRAFTIDAGKTATINTTNDLTLAGATGAATTGALTKAGAGTLTLTGTNTYTGATTVNKGTLELKNAGSGITQTLGALTLAGADVTLKSTQAGSGTLSTTFSSLTARAAGNTANIVSTGGTNGTDNSVKITGQAAGFIDKGVYFNGADFAAMDATGFVRGLNYGTDTNAAAVNAITASKHVKLTATQANQNTLTLLSLNLVGDGVNYTQNAAQTLTVPGIIKSGGGSSTISGGTQITMGTELVVRTDTQTDSLTISSVLAQSTGVLTKSGAGTLILSGTNTYNGATNVNGGTLSIGSNVNLGAQTTGATLNLKGGTLQATNSFGLFNGTAGTNNRAVVLTDSAGFDVTGSNTLTVAGVVSGTGSLTKTNTGTLALSGANTYTGATTISGGTLAMGTNNVFAVSNFQLNGGSLSVGTFTQTTVGSLDLTALGGSITLGSGGVFAFADSSGNDWNSGALSVTGSFVSGSSLRFGTSANGLTSTQLALINLGSGLTAGLDINGFLTASASSVPEPATYAALAGLGILGFAVYRRRKTS